MQEKKPKRGDSQDAIDLNGLQESSPGITKELGVSFGQAASVCLENQGHASGVIMYIGGDYDDKRPVLWRQADEQIRRSYADMQVAVEWGAYGLAALLVPLFTDCNIVERAKKGGGFDYWLGPKDSAGLLFQKRSRLEVSGILNGNESVIDSRVKGKLIQVTPSDGVLPAIIVVVEFGKPCSKMKHK